MSAHTHAHICQHLDSIQVAARRDDGDDAYVYVSLRTGDHITSISGDRDEVVRLLQRMHDAVVRLPQDGVQ